MDTAEQKTVLIGVSGGVAAYKSCEIVRGLQKAGIRVKVMMTEHATHFIDPLTFRSLTHEPVAVGLFDDPSDPIHHISLAAEADVVLLAPCTANVMAKAAHGIADDLFSTTLLATTAPIVVAPAMKTLPRKPTWKPSKDVVSISLKPMTATLPAAMLDAAASPNQNVSFLPSLICSMGKMKSITTLQASA